MEPYGDLAMVETTTTRVIDVIASSGLCGTERVLTPFREALSA